MSFDEFLYRLKERIRAPFNSEKRIVRLVSRLAALGIFAAVVSTLAPTLADELAGSPEIMQPTVAPSVAPTESSVPTESPTPSPSATASEEPVITRPVIASTSPTPIAESTESATVVEAPPAPLEVQPRYIMRIPQSVAVDPRATSYLLPHIYAATGDDSHSTLVCIYGQSGLNFDTRNKLTSQNSQSGPDLIAGDRSGFLMISASTARVVNLINSWAGLQLYSTQGGIAGKALTFQFVAVTKPVIDPTFCSAGRSAATTVIRPLGLQQSTVKGSGTLK
jgi:hypothetical protein